MKRGSERRARLGRAFTWVALAFFALTLVCFVCHWGCGHCHDGMGDVCPFCETFFQYSRLLRMITLTGAAFLLLSGLAAAAGELICHQAFFPKTTLVSLCVKLSD